MKGSHEIVRWAVKSIETYIIENRRIAINEAAPECLLNSSGGSFVSLHSISDNGLRGCIGTIESTKENLALEIRDNAISAAVRDPRFFPVKKEELSNLVVSVDILSVPQEVEDKSFLDPKKFGIIVESGYKRGLLLPDLEGVETVDYQIEIASRKAGISKGEKITLYSFTVDRYH